MPSPVRALPGEEADDAQGYLANEVAAVESGQSRPAALNDRIDEVGSLDPQPYRRGLAGRGSVEVSAEEELDLQACQHVPRIYWNGRYRSLWTLALSSPADPSVASSCRSLLQNVLPC